jgi:hypothetical protein
MNRVQIKLIKDCIEYPYALNDWERGFIDNLADNEENYELSYKENHKLNQIAQKVEEI